MQLSESVVKNLAFLVVGHFCFRPLPQAVGADNCQNGEHPRLPRFLVTNPHLPQPQYPIPDFPFVRIPRRSTTPTLHPRFYLIAHAFPAQEKPNKPQFHAPCSSHSMGNTVRGARIAGLKFSGFSFIQRRIGHEQSLEGPPVRSKSLARVLRTNHYHNSCDWRWLGRASSWGLAR